MKKGKVVVMEIAHIVLLKNYNIYNKIYDENIKKNPQKIPCPNS